VRASLSLLSVPVSLLCVRVSLSTEWRSTDPGIIDRSKASQLPNRVQSAQIHASTKRSARTLLSCVGLPTPTQRPKVSQPELSLPISLRNRPESDNPKCALRIAWPTWPTNRTDRSNPPLAPPRRSQFRTFQRGCTTRRKPPFKNNIAKSRATTTASYLHNKNTSMFFVAFLCFIHGNFAMGIPPQKSHKRPKPNPAHSVGSRAAQQVNQSTTLARRASFEVAHFAR